MSRDRGCFHATISAKLRIGLAAISFLFRASMASAVLRPSVHSVTMASIWALLVTRQPVLINFSFCARSIRFITRSSASQSSLVAAPIATVPSRVG